MTKTVHTIKKIKATNASGTGSIFSAHRSFRLLPLIVLSLMLFLLAGCSKADAKLVVLTTGFNEGELFKIEDSVCTLAETRVYLVNIKNKYENVYGPQIWDVVADGKSLVDSVKDNALADISQIKAMNMQANEKGIALDEDELILAGEAGKEYYDSLTEKEIEYLGLTQDDFVRMYEEYALANKLYGEIIQDITPEVSDDEARTITVQQILIKTYSTDENGQKVEYSAEDKKRAYDRAKMIYDLATDGEHDFAELAGEFSEGEKLEYSFCKGEMDPEYEEAAFNLGKDEISEITETQYGYHILKCITTFNREETDINKISIVEDEKKRVFGEQYDEQASKYLTYLNEELWDSVSIESDPEITTDSFFDIYKKYYS